MKAEKGNSFQSTDGPLIQSKAGNSKTLCFCTGISGGILMSQKISRRFVIDLLRCAILVALMLTPLSALTANGASPIPDTAMQLPLVDNSHFVALEMFFQSDIDAFLKSQSGSLKHYSAQMDGEQFSSAELIWHASLVQDVLLEKQRTAGIEFNLNPKLIIALLESVHGVVSGESHPDAGDSDIPDLLQPNELFDLTQELGGAFIRYYSELPKQDKYMAASFALQDVLQDILPSYTANRIVSAGQPTSLVQSYESLFNIDPCQPLEIIPLQITDLPTFVKPVDAPIGALYDHGGTGRIFTGDMAYVGYSGHRGHDYIADEGTELVASFSGVLFHRRRAGGEPGPTLYAEVVTDVNGDGFRDFKVRYDHLSQYLDPDGNELSYDERCGGSDRYPDPCPVDPMQPVGEVGRTGYSGTIPTHLHFETLRYTGNGSTGNMCDECNTGMMDPFGWWNNDQDLAPGNPESDNTWLWEAADLSDDEDHSFQRFGFENGWIAADTGYMDHAWYTNVSYQWPSGSHKWAVWGLKAPYDGRYHVDVFVPDMPGITYRYNAQYTLFAPSQDPEREGEIDRTLYTKNQQENRGKWVRLGESIELRKGQMVLVKLSTPSGTNDTYTVFDAARLIPHPIDRGLQYSREHQNADGGWGENGSSTGITALVTLAFLNYGVTEQDTTDTDGDGTPDIQEAIQFLLNHYDSDIGRFWGDGHGPEPLYTYDTSLGLLVLIAADRTNDPRKYTDQIFKAKDYLLSIQSVESNGYDPSNPDYGGWGYPRSNWSDLSNTQFAVMALDAAYDYLGLSKPAPSDETTWTYKALRYADSVQQSDGGFDYRQGWLSFGQSVGSMTHAGIWTNLLAGRDPTNTHVQQALNWVQTPPHWTVTENPRRGSAALYYYYVTMAKALVMARKTVLTVDGETHDWFQELFTELTTGGHSQQEDGHWYNTNIEEWESDENLVTAYAILALETRTLPPNTPLSLSIILHSPADLHLYDPVGRHTGKNYETGEIDLQIPGSSYSPDDPQTITVSQPEAGNYFIQLIGTDDGDYEVEITGEQNRQIVDSDVYTGTISSGQAQGSFLTVTAMEGALTIFSTSPEILPIMKIQPANLTFGGSPGDVLQSTIMVSEMQGEQDIQDISLFASDLIDANGNTIPGSSISFDPNTFDLAAGGSQVVNMIIPLDPTLSRGLYSGNITVESINAGARVVPMEIQMIRVYLPIIFRAKHD